MIQMREFSKAIFNSISKKIAMVIAIISIFVIYQSCFVMGGESNEKLYVSAGKGQLAQKGSPQSTVDKKGRRSQAHDRREAERDFFENGELKPFVTDQYPEAF